LARIVMPERSDPDRVEPLPAAGAVGHWPWTAPIQRAPGVRLL